MRRSRRILFEIITILMLGLTWSACVPNNVEQGEQSMVHQYAIVTEAIQQGKNDLIELMHSYPNNGLGIQLHELEQSEIHQSIVHVDIDYDEVHQLDSITSFEDIVLIEKERITPLYFQHKIITSITTRVDNGVWTVSGIRNIDIEHEIEQLQLIYPDLWQSEITMFSFRNLEARVYWIKLSGNQYYHSNLIGFQLEKSIPMNELFLALKDREFEKGRSR